MLLYAGIDEAGYGPMLGPLCVGLCVMGIDAPPDNDRAPDVWSLLTPLVTRAARDAEKAGGIAVDDSKRLKLSNSLKTKHPLVHLERGVFSCARTLWGEAGAIPKHDTTLLSLLGCAHARTDHPVPLPIASDEGALRLTGVKIADAMHNAGVRVLDLSCRCLEPGPFNERLARFQSKASVTWSLVQELVARVWMSHAVRGASQTPRLVLDRQSGRTSYAQALRACVGDGPNIEVVGESPERSVYEITEGDRCLRVLVQREAETDHFPVALASMTAKFVRELAMERFNRSWGTRVPELKPTAGYVSDARRWLNDVRASGLVEERELTPLIRRA